MNRDIVCGATRKCRLLQCFVSAATVPRQKCGGLLFYDILMMISSIFISFKERQKMYTIFTIKNCNTSLLLKFFPRPHDWIVTLYLCAFIFGKHYQAQLNPSQVIMHATTPHTMCYLSFLIVFFHLKPSLKIIVKIFYDWKFKMFLFISYLYHIKTIQENIHLT